MHFLGVLHLHLEGVPILYPGIASFRQLQPLLICSRLQLHRHLLAAVNFVQSKIPMTLSSLTMYLWCAISNQHTTRVLLCLFLPFCLLIFGLSSIGPAPPLPL